MSNLTNDFTSTGAKFWHHQEALEGLRPGGSPRPVTSHIMLTDRCNHKCAFCSVQSRAGESLSPDVIRGYVSQLVPLGLKSVILSGGGNPILYSNDGWDFNDAVDYLHDQGLQIGLITNGMPMSDYRINYAFGPHAENFRMSWKGVFPETLDKLTWIRISMSGLDHKEERVYVPDIDPEQTTLGFSYVAHDIYEVPEEPHHGKVSTKADLGNYNVRSVRRFEERIPTLSAQIKHIVETHSPRYVRLLPNCLEPSLIEGRCQQLQQIADSIDPTRVFVQYKPPQAPRACYLGYLHPVLNCDGYVYPCDSCVLNQTAEHKFAEPWRICRWNEIGAHYAKPVQSLIKDPSKQCPGCVFTRSNELLTDVANGGPLMEPKPATHVNFV